MVVLDARPRKAVRRTFDFPTSRFANRFLPIWLTPNSRHRVDMALEVPRRIHERLIAVIDDLRNAVGQEAARAPHGGAPGLSHAKPNLYLS